MLEVLPIREPSWWTELKVSSVASASQFQINCTAELSSITFPRVCFECQAHIRGHRRASARGDSRGGARARRAPREYIIMMPGSLVARQGRRSLLLQVFFCCW